MHSLRAILLMCFHLVEGTVQAFCDISFLLFCKPSANYTKAKELDKVLRPLPFMSYDNNFNLL